MTSDANKERVAIVGAGIIGLYLAWRLSQKGHSVTVFEKKSNIGGKPCTALISERIKEYLPISDRVYQGRVESILVHFPKKDIRIKARPAYLVFNRDALENFVYDLAKQAGAEIVFNKEIKEIPKGFTKIIGCDGALSQTRQLLSIPIPVCRLGIQFFVDRADRTDMAGESIEVWPQKFACPPKYGFAWKVLKKDNIEYGIIGPTKEAKNGLDVFLTKQEIYLNEGDFKAAMIPQGLRLPKSDKITLLGDSAGMTKPTTGGGIIWGFKAGDILADCFPDFKKYRRKTKRFFILKILKGRIAVSASYFLGNYFPFLLPKKISIDPDLF
ncbi:NAD(P)/FAD-dependent oxidoreductase [Patescibacteria group bacterium]|nr:NAD(P)/FAD-dependent oxidoreductase [Patescibacteria group bacterium]MBU4078186.1 NAD(P)/FAD-dependent oxidoreductase [Patescibacteria group bacterium]MBU4162290.1 NAD(P)/FAD-dependent oxidoreductase [Patescibacteria group bacterium]